MITSIEIENFKGIGERIKLDINPMTLMFGPNSAGKSSIIQALHYAREVIVNGNLDVHQTELGGEYVDLGGFKNLVHGRMVEGTDKDVTIKITIDNSGTYPLHEIYDNIDYTVYSHPFIWLNHKNFINWLQESRPEDFNPHENFSNDLSPWYMAEIKSCSVELSIGWDHATEHPIIKSYSAWINDALVGTISKGPDGDRMSHFNFEHPLLPSSFWCSGVQSRIYRARLPLAWDPEDNGEKERKEVEEYIKQYGGENLEEARDNEWRSYLENDARNPENIPDWKVRAKGIFDQYGNSTNLRSFLDYDLNTAMLWTEHHYCESDLEELIEHRKTNDEKEIEHIRKTMMSWNAFAIISDDYMSVPFRIIEKMLKSEHLQLVQYLEGVLKLP